MNINIPGSHNPYPNDDRVANTCASDTGENQVRDITVVAPGKVAARCGAYPALQGMPDELLLNIFSRLPYRDIYVIKSTFYSADRVGSELLSKSSGKKALKDGINSTAIIWALCSPHCKCR